MTPILITEPLQQALSANDVKIEDYMPAYGGESAALDLYNAGPEVFMPPIKDLPDHDYWLGQSAEKAIIKHYAGQLIHTGLRIAIPKGYVGLIRERGSITKSPLVVRAGVIDSGYTDQIYINAINVSSYRYIIHPKAKTPFQLLIVPVENEFNSISEEEFNAVVANSKRKLGKIGSSDSQVSSSWIYNTYPVGLDNFKVLHPDFWSY